MFNDVLLLSLSYIFIIPIIIKRRKVEYRNRSCEGKNNAGTGEKPFSA